MQPPEPLTRAVQPEAPATVRLWIRLVLILAAGGAHSLSMALPPTVAQLLGWQAGQPVWWLQLLSLGVLAWVLQVDRQHSGQARVAALWGGLFSTAWLTTCFWWIYVSLHTYGGLAGSLSLLAVLVLAGLLALYYAGACALFVLIAPFSRLGSSVVFATLWLLAELARGGWMTGFGWGAAGYAHVEGPLADYAPWLGVYGLSALSAALAMALGSLGPAPDGQLNSGRGLLPVAVIILIVLSLPWGLRFIPSEAPQSGRQLAVTLLQGNIPQDEKFETGTGVPLALQWYGQQLLESRTPLVIAPETALPVLPQQLPPDYWQTLQDHFATGSQAALIGMPLGDYQQGYTNAVVGLKAGQETPWLYAKHHLVPFGEFIPPLFKWFTEMMNIPLGDFDAGPLDQKPFEWQGQRLAPNICYEDLFGEELAIQFLDPRQAPSIFVNVSNLAWFGNSLAMDQHLQIARMRALEFDRPFVLATNTGLTAIVDHRARVIASLPRDTRGVLVGSVEGRSGITPYAWWVARLGLWPYWLLAGGLVILSAYRSRRRRAG